MKNSPLSKLFSDSYAVIWDMDGVLIDSEPYHFLTHRQALSEVEVSITENFYITHGVSADPHTFYATAFAQADKAFDEAIFVHVNARKLELYKQMQHDKGIKLIQPAVAIAKRLYNNGTLMAIASQVSREEVVRNLRNTGILHYFPVIVAGGDFGLAKKPAPDIYLKAVELLNMTPDSCIAIEDSHNGAESAVAANIPCLVVTNHFTENQKFPASAIHTTFAEIAAAI